MVEFRLNLACRNYDRTRALADRSVQPDGIDLNYPDLPEEENFFRMLRYREFEVAELSLSSLRFGLGRKVTLDWLTRWVCASHGCPADHGTGTARKKDAQGEPASSGAP